MPNYSYECLDCKKVFERKLTINEMEKAEIACSKCGSSRIRRLFNGFRFCGKVNSSGINSNGCSSCLGGNCSTCKN